MDLGAWNAPTDKNSRTTAQHRIVVTGNGKAVGINLDIEKVREFLAVRGRFHADGQARPCQNFINDLAVFGGVAHGHAAVALYPARWNADAPAKTLSHGFGLFKVAFAFLGVGADVHVKNGLIQIVAGHVLR
jgi:hypothetical protein